MTEQMEMLEEDTQKGKYMTFKSGNEYFGIELKYICEIIQIQNITEVPETEDYIKGLINLRGKIIPVIDVRLRFKQEVIEYDDRTCIIIINVKSTMVGLIVEKIEDVVTIDEGAITPPPSLSSANGKNKYVYGLGRVRDKVKLLLDPEKILNDEELEMFEDLSNENIMEEN
ncbi:chemotaxis protein CheW [Anaerosporobacter sp.]|uniref:chemotaxis protein CheW n=1 Tax=Anaerosporobacter sp. TaxID=1872529 RepID=UPI00286FA7E8|nr:chemotaxis protein CheW [Anaerosporobacter sp.]